MQEFSFKMTTMIYKAPFGVIIVDPATHVLLYANSFALSLSKTMSEHPILGVKPSEKNKLTCYRLFGKATPCINCPMLQTPNILVNPMTGEKFITKATHVTHEGRNSMLISIRPMGMPDIDMNELVENAAK